VRSNRSAIGARSRALLAETRAHLASMTIDAVLADGLHETLTWIVEVTAELSETIHAEFFDPSPVLPPQPPTQTQSQTQSTA